MKTMFVIVLLAPLFITGCKIVEADYTPPGRPNGLRTETGDNFIELFWTANPENDVAGYNVFVSSAYDGRYELIGSTRVPYFRDNGAANGNTYYYAATAFDYEGNESELSRDVTYDVPRPEGYDVVLFDYRRLPESSGYDFSQYAVVRYTDLYADMYFENYDGDFYMNVRSDTDIQDVGVTNSLLEVKTAPAMGWSPTHDARLYVGHTYVVWTWDDHYAKFRVTSISPSRVVFDWAYQLQPSNPMLKRSMAAGGIRQTAQADKLR